jgi:RNA polymerase sigma-70 factor (ECF subfamily)
LQREAVLARQNVTDGAIGDELVAVFTSSRERAYWIALDITRDPDEAADIVAEALVRAQRGLPRFRGDCSLRTYLLRVVVNLALKGVRRRRVRERLRHLLLGEEHDARTPEHLASCGEQSRALARALDELPARQRAAFVLRHAHELHVAEVAAVLQLSEGTVKTHLSRAVQRLRRALREQVRP